MFYFIYREIITVFCIDSACPLPWFEPRTADNEHPYPMYIKKNYEFCSIKKVFFFNFLIFFKMIKHIFDGVLYIYIEEVVQRYLTDAAGDWTKPIQVSK